MSSRPIGNLNLVCPKYLRNNDGGINTLHLTQNTSKHLYSSQSFPSIRNDEFTIIIEWSNGADYLKMFLH